MFNDLLKLERICLNLRKIQDKQMTDIRKVITDAQNSMSHHILLSENIAELNHKLNDVRQLENEENLFSAKIAIPTDYANRAISLLNNILQQKETVNERLINDEEKSLFEDFAQDIQIYLKDYKLLKTANDKAIILLENIKKQGTLSGQQVLALREDHSIERK